MAAPIIKLKRSAVAGKRPTLANLPLGEIALNTYDGKLFVRQDTSGVGIATTVRTVNPWSENFVSGGEHSIYYTGGDVGVGIQNPTTKLHVDGTVTATSYIGDGSQLTGIGIGIHSGSTRIGTGFTDIKFVGSGVSSIVGSGDTVTINIPADTTIVRQVETATGVTTDFTITDGYTVGFIDVYLNGVKQRVGTDFTATNGTTVSMIPFIDDGDVLEFQIYKNLSMGESALPAGTQGQLLQHNGSSYVGVASTGFRDYVINHGQGYYAYTTDYYTVGVANTTQEIEDGVWTLVQPQVASDGLYNHQATDMNIANSGNPWVGSGATIGTGQTEFSLAGTKPGSSCIVRTVIRFEPDVDETDLDMRLHFTTNTATQGTGLTNFNIEKQALVMTVGAAVTYTSETLISFFVGDTLYGDTKEDAGRFSVQVNGTTDGTLEILGLTVMVDV